MKTITGNRFAALGFLFLGLFGAFQPAAAQNGAGQDGRYSFNFSGISLAHTLEILAAETGNDFVYDPALIAGYHVYYRADRQPLGEILTAILQGSDLDYIILSSGTYVIVRTSRNPTPYGSLSGRVVDTETGMPLPNATILLADASGGTSSNRAGHFSLNRLLPGKHLIIFSYVGYEPVIREIEIPPGGALREEIPLRPGAFQVSPIVVTAHQPILPPGGGGNLERLSGWTAGPGARDPVQSLSLFSGVQYGIPLTDLHLQGSDSGDHRIYLDGVPVYHPYSFGRLTSAFSPYALDRIEVQKAGFGVEEGSYTAGRVNLGNQGEERKPYDLMVAFRTTFWEWYRSPSLSSALESWDLVDPITWPVLLGAGEQNTFYRTVQSRSDIDQHDLHIAGRLEAGPYRSFHYSIYQGGNAIETGLLAADTGHPEEPRMFSNDRYRWNNLVTRIRYDWLATSRLETGFQASLSTNRFSHRYAMFDDGSIRGLAGGSTPDETFRQLQRQIGNAPYQLNRNRIDHFTVSSDLGYALSTGLTLRGGVQYDHIFSRLDVNELFYLPTLAARRSDLIGSYLGVRWRMRPELTLDAGSRFTMFLASERLYPEPRASIQYERAYSSSGTWSVRLSGGLYRQFIHQFDITNPGPSSLVPGFTIWAHDHRMEQPRAWHTALSFLLDPWQQTTLRLELYRKFQPVTWITSYHNLMVDHNLDRGNLQSFAEKSDFAAWGGGITLQHSFPDESVHLMAAYDLSVSRIRMESQFGRRVPAPWNEPHRIQGRAIVRLAPRWSTVANWQSIYGRAWAFRQSYYDFLVPHNLPHAGAYDFTRPEQDRLRPFHQLDLSVIFRPGLSTLNAELRLDLVNLLNRRNHLDWNLIPSETASGSENWQIFERTLPGFTPSASAKIHF